METVRVVITAIGAVTPLGPDWPTSYAAALAGKSGIGPLTLFDGSRLPPTVVGEVKDFDAEALVGRKQARLMDRVSALSIAAGREAFASAGLAGADPARVGIVYGSAIGGFPMVEQQARILVERGWERLSPHFLANVLVDSPSGHLAIDLGLRGPNFAVVSACSTGAHAVGVAMEMLRRGEADAILAGGAEACITELLMGGFHSMRALGTPREPDDLGSASRPFDATRNGFVIAEGACVLVLEREDDARARGATPIAEVLAYGASNDAYHMVAPHPAGLGVIEMMRAALARGGLTVADVGYINAHGTSTPLNDRSETAAIRAVFGDHADRLAVSSTKSMTGHLLGAAGAFETAICAVALRDQVLPPTINHREADPECDLDYVLEGARRVDGLEVALSNSAGLGGHNGCTLLRRLSP